MFSSMSSRSSIGIALVRSDPLITSKRKIFYDVSIDLSELYFLEFTDHDPVR